MTEPDVYPLTPIDPQNYTIRIGSTYFDRGGVIHKVSHVFVRDAGNDNDMALLRTSTTMNIGGSRTKAIKLTESDEYPETDTKGLSVSR